MKMRVLAAVGALALVALAAIVLSPAQSVVLEQQGPRVDYLPSKLLVQDLAVMSTDLNAAEVDEQRVESGMSPQQQLKMHQLQRNFWEGHFSDGTGNGIGDNSQSNGFKELNVSPQLHAVPNGLLDIQPDSVLNIDSSDEAVWGPGGDPFKKMDKLKPRFSRAAKKSPKSAPHYWEGHFGDGSGADVGDNSQAAHARTTNKMKKGMQIKKAKTDKLWMFNMGYEHHEMRPLNFGSWN